MVAAWAPALFGRCVSPVALYGRTVVHTDYVGRVGELRHTLAILGEKRCSAKFWSPG